MSPELYLDPFIASHAGRLFECSLGFGNPVFDLGILTQVRGDHRTKIFELFAERDKLASVIVEIVRPTEQLIRDVLAIALSREVHGFGL